MSTRTTKRLLVLAVIIFVFLLFLAVGFNTQLETTYYDYTNSKIPAEFDGYRILQISDYHNEDFGNHQASFLAAVAEAEPDIIVLTGDIVDEDHPDIIAAKEMTEGIVDIAPVYFITGNHELEPGAAIQFDSYRQVMQDNSVMELDGTQVMLQQGDAVISLTGQGYVSRYITQFLEPADPAYFNILLYHGSDNFDLIAPLGYDLTFAGHVHGGLVRLPFVGGVFANDGTLFPKYDAGVFQNGNATMVSSRGIGDAELPRFLNRPEIVVVTLHSETASS